MVNSTSLRFIFGFLSLVALSLMLVIGIAYYEETVAIRKSSVGTYCAPDAQC